MRLNDLAEMAGLIIGAIGVVSAVPTSFPASGNVMWYTAPGTDWLEDYLPVGNGYLAAMLPGNTNQEVTQLNIESLWSGGPFQDPTYNGSQKAWDQRAALAEDMQQIRQTIFSDGTIGDVEVLAAPIGAYGSYAGAGSLLSTMNVTGDVTGYTRWLDMDNALVRTRWTQADSTFLRTTFCSHPAQACVEHINTTSTALPPLTYAFDITQEGGLPQPDVTCFDNSTLQIRGLVADPGMTYEILVRVQTASVSGLPGFVSCNAFAGFNSTSNATLTVTNATESWITWVGGTNFDQSAGDAAHSFSFKGADPHTALVSQLTIAASSGNSNSSNATSPSPIFVAQLDEHIADYVAVATAATVDLGQEPDLSTPTDQLYKAYIVDGTDPRQTYVEWLMFNFGRYLLIGSARGALPANLQGKWANGATSAWSADYHANINVQMNYWMAEPLGLNLTQSLWDYMELNWAPRGSETAKITYNISEGWTTHNEMNIFGHTGMKLSGDSAQWADYPESSVWMMIHVWDHFDFTGDTSWWKAQGYPLLKGVAQFQLQKLIKDQHFNDTTLVTAPCNSPEQVPITLGCSHQQQLIWQLLNAVEKGYQAAGDTDEAFLNDVQSKRAQMDYGIHVGWWGQLQEWKIDMDSPTDTHRHLSHLIGLYPGYAIASFNATAQSPIFTNSTLQHYTPIDVLNAAEISLIHRGNGTGPDADAGWEKVWRAAAWAQLANATEFYHELSYSIERNFGPNFLSEYATGSGIFQIDANLGYPAAVLNALVQSPDTPAYSDTLTITLLPALPDNWSSGSVTGIKLRGGMTLDMKWSGGEPTDVTISTTEQPLGARPVQVKYKGAVKASFSTGTVSTQSITI